MRNNKFKNLTIAVALSFGISGCALFFGQGNPICEGIGIAEDDPAFLGCDVITSVIVTGTAIFVTHALISSGGNGNGNGNGVMAD